MMPSRIISFLLFSGIILLSCNRKNSAEDSGPVTDSMISEVVNFIIDEYSDCEVVLGGTRYDATYSSAIDTDSVHGNVKLFCNQLERINWLRLFDTKFDSIMLEKLDSLFTDDDFDFMYSQLKGISNFKLCGDLVHAKRIISNDTLDALEKSIQVKKPEAYFWTIFHDKYGEGSMCNISMPLFSRNKSLVIVHSSSMQAGLGGHGETVVYKKEEGKWVHLLSLMGWIA